MYKTQKENLQTVVNNLDTMAETRLLTDGEREQLEKAPDDLIKLLREEELKFYQRAKATDVLLGDNNTKYFQMIANAKHRKKHIFSLEHEENKIEGQNNLKNYITQFYKELFGPSEDNHFTLSDRMDDIPQVSMAENEFFTAPFTEKEIRMQFSPWNIIKLRAQMVSRLNSISIFGMSSKGTFCASSMTCIMVTFPFSA